MKTNKVVMLKKSVLSIMTFCILFFSLPISLRAASIYMTRNNAWMVIYDLASGYIPQDQYVNTYAKFINSGCYSPEATQMFLDFGYETNSIDFLKSMGYIPSDYCLPKTFYSIKKTGGTYKVGSTNCPFIITECPEAMYLYNTTMVSMGFLESNPYSFDIYEYTPKYIREQNGEFTDPCEHAFVVSTMKEATCTTNGENQYKCEICGFSYVEAKEKSKHVYHETERINPTCDKEGIISYACENCGKTYNEGLPKIEHDYQLSQHIEGTCKTKEQLIYTCSFCGDIMTEIKLYGEHNMEKQDTSIESTCDNEGKLVEKCLVCGEEEETVLSALGHEYSEELEVLKNPTCIDSGEMAYVCVRCSNTQGNVLVPSTGHKSNNVPDIIKHENFFIEGEAEYRCENCNAIISTEKIPATGGSFRFIIPGVTGFGIICTGVVLFVRKRMISNGINEWRGK